jgi:hypothetical protein
MPLAQHTVGRAVAALIVAGFMMTGVAFGQKPLTPTETVVAFYRLLREQNYRGGMALSVFADAVADLPDEDLAELTPDFQRTFTAIPEKLDIRGEQISGDAATVFVRFAGPDADPDAVTLIRDGGKWLVGDRDVLAVVREQRTEYFFNVRIGVNHNEVFDLLRRITGSEDVHFHRSKAYATLGELIATEGLTDDLKEGTASGYRFTVNLTPDRQGYTVVAIPVRYGRTGRLSFYADAKEIRGADAKGLVVSEQAPVLSENNFDAPPTP